MQKAKVVVDFKSEKQTPQNISGRKGFCANERELAASSAMIRDAYKSLTGGKDMLEGRLWSAGAIRWKGNVKTNDRDTGGQISPAADAAGPKVTGEVGGGEGGIDWSSLATIDQLSTPSVRESVKIQAQLV